MDFLSFFRMGYEAISSLSLSLYRLLAYSGFLLDAHLSQHPMLTTTTHLIDGPLQQLQQARQSASKKRCNEWPNCSA